MKRSIVIATGLSASLLAFAAEKNNKPALSVPQSELTWVQPYGPQGPSMGFVVGSFGNERPASLFIKLPAGADSGWHVHDADYESVVLKGTMTAQQQGEQTEKSLPAGSYFTQPAKQNHRNGCLKESGECLLFVHFEHGASTHPMTPEGKAVAKEKSGKQ